MINYFPFINRKFDRYFSFKKISEIKGAGCIQFLKTRDDFPYIMRTLRKPTYSKNDDNYSVIGKNLKSNQFLYAAN